MRLGPIEFFAPALVEGPRVMFFIPCPEGFPLAMKLTDGTSGLPVTITVITTWAIMLVFYLLFHFGLKKLDKNPSKRQVLFEMLYNGLDSLVGSVLGKWKKKYFVYIGTLICFIFLANITSFFPIPGFSYNEQGQLIISTFFRGPNADINTTLGLALITTFSFIAASLKTNGILGYFKGLMEPTPVMLPMNIIGELAKPTNISMRLFGNNFAGMVIIGLIYMAAPWFVPVPLHLYFDLFGGLVQSFVFTMLTLVYIQQSLGNSEPEGEF